MIRLHCTRTGAHWVCDTLRAALQRARSMGLKDFELERVRLH